MVSWKTDRDIQTAAQMSEVIMGTYHTKGSLSTPKNNLDLLGVFVCVCLFFSPLLLGHMLLTRFSAQEKRKEYRAMGMGKPGETRLYQNSSMGPRSLPRVWAGECGWFQAWRSPLLRMSPDWGCPKNRISDLWVRPSRGTIQRFQGQTV